MGEHRLRYDEAERGPRKNALAGLLHAAAPYRTRCHSRNAQRHAYPRDLHFTYTAMAGEEPREGSRLAGDRRFRRDKEGRDGGGEGRVRVNEVEGLGGLARTPASGDVSVQQWFIV